MPLALQPTTSASYSRHLSTLIDSISGIRHSLGRRHSHDALLTATRSSTITAFPSLIPTTSLKSLERKHAASRYVEHVDENADEDDAEVRRSISRERVSRGDEGDDEGGDNEGKRSRKSSQSSRLRRKRGPVLSITTLTDEEEPRPPHRRSRTTSAPTTPTTELARNDESYSKGANRRHSHHPSSFAASLLPLAASKTSIGRIKSFFSLIPIPSLPFTAPFSTSPLESKAVQEEKSEKLARTGPRKGEIRVSRYFAIADLARMVALSDHRPVIAEVEIGVDDDDDEFV